MDAGKLITQDYDGEQMLNECDDSSLLSSIALHRDRDALNELYLRYQRRAYNVAFHIVQNSALADEAVQEAMLSIWQSAKLDPRKDVSEFVLGVVAGKCLNLKRSQRRQSKREERMAIDRIRSENSVSDEIIEKSETIAALRNQIERLPDLDRQLLACCYGAGMTHRKIADFVGLSQSSVTEKIKHAIERLRVSLTGVGVAAIVPVLSAENLFEAMTTGHECPLGMIERFASRIDGTVCKAAKSLSRRASTVRPTWVPFVLGLAVCAALAGGIIFVLSEPKQAVPNTRASQNPNPSPSLAISPVQNEEKPIHAHWSFEKGPAEDLKVLQKNWKWQRTSANSGQMVAPLEPGLLVALPIAVPAHPIVIKINTSCDVAGEICVGALWMNGELFVPIRQWISYKRSHARLDVSLYFIDRYMVGIRADGATNFVFEAKTAYPSRSIALYFARLNIQDIEVNSLIPSEIPDSLRDIPKLIQQLGVEPKDCDEHGN